MQPEMILPDFIENNTAEEIHERMMASLPEDIDDMPGGFPYDFTMPAAVEKAELIEFYLVRAIMLAFPEYAWDEWLDLHAKQIHLVRHPESYAVGSIKITGEPGTEIEKGTIVCTSATDYNASVDFYIDEDCVIGADGTVIVGITAAESGPDSNVRANSITMLDEPDSAISGLINPEAVTGGMEEESDDDFYDRIAMEYESSLTYLGNDNDYIRWAKEAGAADCIVTAAADGPGTVKLVLIGTDGAPADEKLLKAVYEHIVSPNDRSKRLLPTACAKLSCVSAKSLELTYQCTGLLYDDTTDLTQIKADFKEAVEKIYSSAKNEKLLRYNAVRPLISSIAGVEDFTGFFINGKMENIPLSEEEYPKTGELLFSTEVPECVQI